MLEIIFEAVIDTLKLVPFLFIAFLIIEFIEHKMSDKSKNIIAKSDKFGPIIGSILGIIPQCGFSSLATNLYVTRIISLGTLISIYLSTSDEMLPLLLSENVSINIIVKILLIKVLVGMFFGFLIDFFLRKREKVSVNYDICDDEDCDCEHGIILSSVKHTFNILIFILICNFILNVMFHYLGHDYLSNLFMKDSLFSPFVTSLIGLIPNCGASVVLTQLFINDAINMSALISGLLTGSGVATLVLLKENKNKKESLFIILMIYLIGVISGIGIEIFNLIF